ARTISRADSDRGSCAPAFSAARIALLLAAGLGSAAGCGEPAGRPEPVGQALLDLERLAFVPAGECILQPRSGFRVACRNEAPLLVDRFETTRGEWRAWYQGVRERDPIFEAVLATWKTETDAWPASFMTLAEAQVFASSRGLRLLGAREWIRIACGTRALPYPWGGTEASSVANTLNLGVGHPLPVGTFEQGRTPLSTYDMAGNVWEWVSDPIVQPITTEDGASGSVPAAWAMGGSYLARQRRLHDLDGQGNLVLNRLDLEPASRSIDIGLRCATDAAEYLAARARSFGGGREPERERLRAVGASWGRDAVPLLEDLARTPGAPPGLGLLLEGARR
ncbi:MAG: formylglycine-generating enzyme family protein, partial [Planctomycetota bacterium]